MNEATALSDAQAATLLRRANAVAQRAMDMGRHPFGALLVAPPEIERDDLRQQIPGWAPPARARLPFASIVVASSDDAYGSLESASRLAADWGATFYNIGPRGHINAESGLGDWDEGRALLRSLAPAIDTR